VQILGGQVDGETLEALKSIKTVLVTILGSQG
jgi:hypothetical protein